MMLYLTRKIGNVAHQLAINTSHIISFYPAVSFDHNGKATFSEGTDIWTTLEAGGGAENASAWRVIEDFEVVRCFLAKEPLT